MKLSMWLLYCKLQKFNPVADIHEGGACITGIFANGAKYAGMRPVYGADARL